MTTDEENLIIENINMAHDVSWKYYQKLKGIVELDELYSVALLGLTKAAPTFKEKFKINFSTYAYRCMTNEILLYLYQYNKNKNVSSLSVKISEDLEVQDIISSLDNLEDNLVSNSLIDNLYKEIDKLDYRYSKIITYKLKGLTMHEIGKILNLSQPQISRDYNKALNILRNKLKDWEG